MFWLAGAVWLFAGRHVMLWAAPSIAFLFFMMPLPFRAERMLSVQLQGISTKISCWTLQFFGQPAISEGNVIYLNNVSYGVAEACSGMRIFMASVAFACAYMIMVRRTWWERMLILPFAIPLAMVANAMRIVATTLLTRYTSIEPAVAHDAMGLAMIPFAFVLFGAVVWYLGKLITDADKMDMSTVVKLD